MMRKDLEDLGDKAAEAVKQVLRDNGYEDFEVSRRVPVSVMLDGEGKRFDVGVCIHPPLEEQVAKRLMEEPSKYHIGVDFVSKDPNIGFQINGSSQAVPYVRVGDADE